MKHFIIIVIALFNIYNNGLSMTKHLNSLCDGEQGVVKSESVSHCYSSEFVVGSAVDQRGITTCSPSNSVLCDTKILHMVIGYWVSL